ncbi:hypothetical protein AVL59_32710 [Streptomyces griseochromogenes]|uniref:Uncharacterized protein n=1 Tax=Streptomyces griseochromogenes TaxID=68214 RepID=A0A1B1B4C8_9ACTN|nr:hypothetical protein AVL59_32710 [Streptomyces griseochromogenes]
MRYAHPESNDGHWEYLIPHRQARTETVARAEATARHNVNVARLARPQWARGMEVQEVTFRPGVLLRERALTWIALQRHGAITERGWPLPAERGAIRQDDWWRSMVAEEREELRGRVQGFGVTVADAVGWPASRSAKWAVEPYTDRFGRVWWDKVRAELHKSGMSWLWQTPYGVVWVDRG